MFPITFLTTIILVLSVAANDTSLVNGSLITVPIAKSLNFTGVHNFVKHDQARAKQVLRRSGAQYINEPVSFSTFFYIASVGVGSPASQFNLGIDTITSNTWIGAKSPYHQTSTSVKTSNSVVLNYGAGLSFSGTEYIDQVTVAPGLVIHNQSIGVASTVTGFQAFGLDGVLALGPAGLSRGTLSPDTDTVIATATDNLFSQHQIAAPVIGISFEPATAIGEFNGEITWGGTDESRFTGAITYLPITTTSPSNLYWGIDLSVRYSTSTTIFSATAGVVETGNNVILIASDAFSRYMSATGAVLDAATALPSITPAQFNNLKSLFFITRGATFELTANAQIWPRSLNTVIGGTQGKIYLMVGDIGTPSGVGLDFMLGMAFLQRFYVVLDTQNKRVGLAETRFTKATSN